MNLAVPVVMLILSCTAPGHVSRLPSHLDNINRDCVASVFHIIQPLFLSIHSQGKKKVIGNFEELIENDDLYYYLKG